MSTPAPGTPLPWISRAWSQEERGIQSAASHPKTGKPIHVSGAAGKMDARYIVTACNAFPDLLEALEELNAAISDGLCNAGSPGFDADRLDRAQTSASAAIAKAKGGAA